MEDILQWLGTAGVVAFYPLQNWRLILTRNPVGLSFLAFSFLMVGISGYLALGLQLDLPGLVFGNASNILFASLILLFIWFRSSTLGTKERVVGLGVLTGGIAFLVLLHVFYSGGTLVSLVGWVGVFGVVAFYPIQNFALFKKKDATGLSLAAFISLAIGLAFYAALGVVIKDLTILLGNGITFLGTLLIIWMILRKRK